MTYVYKSININPVIVDNYIVTKEPGLESKYQIEVLDVLMGVTLNRYDDGVLKVKDLNPTVINPYQSRSILEYGAKCDAKRTYSGGSITSGTNIFTDLSIGFTSADVGKLMYVPGAGVNGTILSTTIIGFTSTSVVTLGTTASTTVANACCLCGSDDTTAWINAIAATGNDTICTITVPYGLSITDCIAVKSNVSIQGVQADGWAFRNVKRCSGLILKPGAIGPAHIYGVISSVGNIKLNNLYLDGAAKFQGNTVVKYSGGGISAGSNTFVDAGASFASTDIGKKIAVYGAGVGGTLQDAAYVGIIRGVTNATTVTIDDISHPATATVSNAGYSYGFSTKQGVDGVTSTASTAFSSASANFTSADVGKTIEIYGATAPAWGTGALNTGDGIGCILSCTIAAVTDANNLVLSQVADLAITGATWRIGVLHCIYQPASATSQDSMWHIDHVVSLYYSGSGYVIGNFQRAQRINRFYSWQQMGMGMMVNSSDNAFVQCMFAECGEDGVYVNQSTNHFDSGDVFNNCGNGMFFSAFAQMSTIMSYSIDNNEKNGILTFGKGSMLFGVRFTSNSQCGHGLYSDFVVDRKTATGVTNLNAPGVTAVGCFWSLGGNGNKPGYLISSIGPFGIKGTGALFDPALTLWAISAITSGEVSTLHQTSFVMEGGTTMTLKTNNTFKCNNTKFGSASTDTLGFWGATGIVRPTVSGAKGSNAALGSLITALVNAGLIADTTSA